MHEATRSRFPISGPRSHLKMTRLPGFYFILFFFFFFSSETKVERKGCICSGVDSGGCVVHFDVHGE